MSRSADFWSRRRAAVAAEEAAAATRAETEATEARAAEIAEESDAAILERFGLPDPDTLRPGDAVAGFMRREIPERLRRRALRKLWTSNPVLACVDGLNDYDGDYTGAVTDAPGVRTAYEVGRGLRRHVEALARSDAAQDDAPAAAEKTQPADTALAENPQDDGKDATAYSDLQPADDAAPASTTKVAMEPFPQATQEDTGEDPLPPRRMRFRFDTGTS
ncbi:hypothetical protein ROJ8625_03867 [Roseivivax jejudonensis]|uniref:DUF3306 domain-containing protein n=1 Tax=Roseivivax jejudonensis TaxID=1529041 RepID=A0A1X7A8H7_9RHOB|nr:DUF3306 domain-containing protein [Roseivivax jejudonensis]SLN72686.1 hypothetical protein ROJ8625_03867 [Roseivivax jejudonensis]